MFIGQFFHKYFSKMKDKEIEAQMQELKGYKRTRFNALSPE